MEGSSGEAVESSDGVIVGERGRSAVDVAG